MKSTGRSDSSDSLVGVAWAIATGFHDIDFTTHRPRSIDVIGRQHPDGRPDPVALREASSDLNTTICDGMTVSCVKSSTLDWVDDRLRRTIRDLATCCKICVRAIRNVVREAVEDSVLANNIRCQGGHEVENAVLDI